MTNHITYPFHELRKGCCVICFENGTYSACYLLESTKKYLSESEYLSGACRIDYRSADGETYHMTKEEFVAFVKSGELKAENSEKSMLTENGEIKKCPFCGKPLSVKVASKGKNAGKLFYGCTGYPSCRFIENI